jgi:hypothetical protein
MEAVIINKPAMRLIGLATNVTLYDWSRVGGIRYGYLYSRSKEVTGRATFNGLNAAGAVSPLIQN